MTRLAQRLVAQARQQWPEITIDEVQLAQHLVSLGHVEALPSHPLDLFLAYASLRGDPRACAELEQGCLVSARAKVRYLVRDDALVDDVLQRLREKLWTGPAPALAGYAGTAPLRSWLHTVAKRCAIDELRKLQRQQRCLVEIDEDTPHGPAPERGPESLLDGERQYARFQDAVARAVKTLPARERILLRLHYRDGVSAQAIGQAYGVHRATATRWLGELRANIFAAAQAALEQEQRLDKDEFRSLAGKLHDQLDWVISSWSATSE